MGTRRTIAVVAAAATVAAGLTAPSPAAALSTDVVISQIYGGGGNAGATFTHDFIEIQNRGSSPVILAGWSVQYASSAGTTWQATPLTGTIPPGGFRLIQESQGTGGTTPLPTPDDSGTIAMSATAGKVALVRVASPLTCGANCDTAANVHDFVGYGAAANDFEGGPTPTLSNTTAARRTSDDSDNNAADFEVFAPTPRNSGSPPEEP
jgi:uncharacterized protein